MNIRNILFFAVNILYLFGADCSRIYRNFTENFYNFAVTQGHVYIGGNHSLIKLNSTLNVVETIPVSGRNWLLTPFVTPDGDTILILCNSSHTSSKKVYSAFCKGIPLDELTSETSYKRGAMKIEKLPVRYVTTKIGTDNILTIVSSGCLQNHGESQLECLAISNYQKKLDVFKSHTVRYLSDEDGNLALKGVVLDFKSVIVHEHSTYFLLQLNNMKSKLGKMCTTNKIYETDLSKEQNTYEDMPIYCTHNGVTYTVAHDMMFWNDNLLVTFSNGDRSVICKFTDISKKFRTSRQETLKCQTSSPDEVVHSNKYFKRNSFEPCYNESTGVCGSNPCKELNGDFCEQSGIKLYASIEGNIPLEGDFIINTGYAGAMVKIIDVLQTEEFAVVNVGTDIGYFGTIFINGSVPAVPVGNFRKVQYLSPIIDIKKDGENVFVMTKNMVVNVANTDDCSGNNCEECMMSKNLRCGWDIINRSCNKEYNKSFWVPSAGKACLRIMANDSVVKDGVSASDKDNVNIKFKLVPAIKLESIKYMLGDRKNGELVKKDDGYYHIDTVEVTSADPIILKVTDTDGTVIVDSTQVNLYQCGTATGCTSCVKDRDCIWCPLQSKCVKNGRQCNTDGITRIKIEEREEGNCSRVDNTQKVLLAVGETEDIEVSALKLDFFDDLSKISCLVGNKKYPADTNDLNTIVCKGVKAPNKPNDNEQVKLQYNNNDLDNSAELEIYDCKDFGKPDGNCGNCRYQSSLGYKCQWCGTCRYKGSSGECNNKQNCKISVKEISPYSGPEFGGTKIAIIGNNIGNPNDNITVELYGVACTGVKVVKPSTELTCTTGNFSTAPISKPEVLVINVNSESVSVPAGKLFQYKKYTDIHLLSFHPNTSIKAGGRKITIRGNNIGFERKQADQYKVSFCQDGDVVCIECSDVKINDRNDLMCRIGKSDTTAQFTSLHVTIDSNTVLKTRNQILKFVDNPNINKLKPGEATVIKSGGAAITFKGSRFKNVGEVRVNNVNVCEIISDTKVKCPSPPFVKSDFERRKRSIGQNVNINFDNYQVQSTIYYVEDPKINPLTPNILEYKEEKAIVLKGINLLEGASIEDYSVRIGLDGNCYIQDMTNENITCLPPKDVPRTNNSDENTVYVMVVVGRIRITVGHLKYISPVPILMILIIVLATAFVLAVSIGIGTTFILRRRKKKAEENFQMELISREENIRQASREEFADAQMTIRDIKSDLVTSRVPFFDYQTYAFHQLFPNQEMETHPLLHDPMITDDNRTKVQRAMGMLDGLMNNKLFLKELVLTLDHEKRLTMKDKAHFASLLSVAVVGKMKLFYELVSCLLNEMVQSASRRQYKVLFRRVESVTQRLMVNWLELILYDHLKNQSGMQLFMLYKATQIVIEKGPIDAVTRNSRNTLAEERLLKSRVEYDTMTLNIDLNGNSDQRFPVSVLNCDTITQVKQKAIIAIYKNKPASEVPTPDELELEWHQGRGGKLVLQDIDNISDRNNGMIRLNMLKHYMVKDGSEMALMYREMVNDDPDEIYVNENAVGDEEEDENQQAQNALLANPDHIKLQMPDSTGDQGMRWHLSNLTDEEKSDKEHEIGELFLNRLFHTKLLLRDYIDAAFDEMTDPQSLSIPVRYFLCMIDKLGKDVGVDNDVLQSWKSECYATRVWASLISKPQILFDVNVPSHVEPCMDILKQVFIDSFTQDTQNVSKDSSTQKLLFYKDVPDYRKRVNSFFLRVESVPDQEFWRAIEGISNLQTREIKFSRQATLHQLFKFISKYKNEIIEDFSGKDEAQNLEFGKKLEEIMDLMEETGEPRYV